MILHLENDTRVQHAFKPPPPERRIWVNPDKVTYVIERVGGGTDIYIASGHIGYTTESFEEVMSKLDVYPFHEEEGRLDDLPE